MPIRRQSTAAAQARVAATNGAGWLSMAGDRSVLDDQIAYYRARAPEYDQWFNRQGRYDRGSEINAQWFREVHVVESELRALAPLGTTLELACGTGLWTQHLVDIGSRVVAVDASPEAIGINRDRVRSPKAEYVVADIFSFAPRKRFDTVFFAFWLSHVPSDRFEVFWQRVGSVLKPGGRVFLIDSMLEPHSTAIDHKTPDRSGVVRRKLNDGREFDIVKIFYEPSDLERRLSGLGWNATIRSTDSFFLYGSAQRDK